MNVSVYYGVYHGDSFILSLRFFLIREKSGDHLVTDNVMAVDVSSQSGGNMIVFEFFLKQYS